MKKALLTLAGVGLTTSLVFAQQQTVRGTIVSSEDGEPIIGATVVVKGKTTIGAATDLNGKFTLNVPKGSTTLVVSYVGYQTQEVAVKDNLTVKLLPEDTKLKEVMVVAYGTTTKNAFTGSASKVSVEKLQNKSATDITKALEGEIPGVRVFTTTGQPGESAQVQIRGIGSVNSHTTPLYVVDGVPYGMNMSGIDQSDIETMTVLKDASATALYGSRAANGVVLITTRKGRAGKIVVEAEGKMGVNTRLIPLYDGISSPEEYMEVAYQSMNNRYNSFGLKEVLNEAYAWTGAEFKTGLSKADAPTTPGELLFFNGVFKDKSDASYSINTRYNLWNAKSSELIDPTTGKFNNNVQRLYTPETWSDHLFRTGSRYDGNVKVSGGSDKVTFFSSLGYSKDVGYYIGSDFGRFNIRNNVSANITNNLRSTVNLSYARTQANSPGQTTSANNGFQFVNQIPAIYPVFQYDEQGQRVADPKIVGGYAYDYGSYSGYSRPYAGLINPAGALQLDRRENIFNLVTANINLEYRFLRDFKATVTYGTQFSYRKMNSLTNPYYGDAAGKGRISKYSSDYYDNTFTQILSWARKFGKHNLDAFVAHESTENETEIVDATRSLLVDANSFDFNNAVINDESSSFRIGYAIESYFGQVRYDYDDRYFVSASIRRDGSSRFTDGHRWGTFGSIGAAWIISKEKFLKDVKWIDNLKLKASYGVLGNQNLDLDYSGTTTPDYYLGFDLYRINNLNNLPSFSFFAKGNPALTWEKSSTLNFGFEADLFKRLTLNVEFFHKRTTDMLFKKQTAPSIGYAYFPSNEGKLTNTGVELELSYQAIKSKAIDLNFRFNGAMYRNRLTEMALDPVTKTPKMYENQGLFAYMKNRSVMDYYLPVYKGVNPDNGLPLWESYYYETTENGKTVENPVKDLEDWKANGNDPATLKVKNTSTYEEATSQYVGKSAIPDFVGGFGFDVRVHDFTLSTSLSFGLGGYGYDYAYAWMMHSGAQIGARNWHKDIHRAWKQKGDVTDVPVLASGATELEQSSERSTRFLTSRSYLNLSNVRLSYSLPSKTISRLGLSKATVFLSGDNLFLISARKGFVSMSSAEGESDVSRYLPLSTITAGVQVRF